MPPMISPTVVANGASAPSSAAQAGPRGRGTDEAQGRGFGAALERSRAGAGKAANAQDGAAPATDIAAADRKPVRKPGAEEDSTDAALPADPNLAFLAPLNTPLHALTLAGRASAQAAQDSDAAGVARTAGAKDIPLDTGVQDPLLAKPAADAAPLSADAKALADAARSADGDAAAKDAAAKPAAPTAANTPLAADDTPATALHDAARAAIAAQTMAVGMPRPAGTPGGAPVGTAASGRAASPRTTVSATTAEQLASAAQPKATAPADDAKAAATPTAVPATAAGDGTDAQNPATPFAVQQAAAVTASAERSGDAQATRPAVHTIAPEVGSEKWGPALGQQLARMSTSGHHTAELNLNPAGLGPLKVTLSIGDNQAQAMFVSAHESVRKAVEAALPQLRTSLSEQGITLGQTSVGADTRQPFGQDAAFAQQQQQQQQNASRQGAPAYPGTGRAASVATAPVAPARTAAPVNAGPGVDTFA